MRRFFGGPSGISIPFSYNSSMETHKLVSHDYGAAHADWNLTENEAGGSYFSVTNANLAANMVFPTALSGKICGIYNASGYTISIKVTGQSAITVANTKYICFTFNATTAVALTAAL